MADEGIEEANAMAGTLRVRRIGNSLGFTVPKAMADLPRLKEGDTLHAVVEGAQFASRPMTHGLMQR
jgi:antitoxin component of MazEF toxin-antitoxin module